MEKISVVIRFLLLVFFLLFILFFLKNKGKP